MKQNSNGNDQNQNRTSQKQIELIEQHKEINDLVDEFKHLFFRLITYGTNYSSSIRT